MGTLCTNSNSDSIMTNLHSPTFTRHIWTKIREQHVQHQLIAIKTRLELIICKWVTLNLTLVQQKKGSTINQYWRWITQHRLAVTPFPFKLVQVLKTNGSEMFMGFCIGPMNMLHKYVSHVLKPSLTRQPWKGSMTPLLLFTTLTATEWELWWHTWNCFSFRY